MDAYLFSVIARSAERLIALLLGGMTIYLGFRLFYLLPVETHSDGRIKLPGFSVVLGKAGPGLFFTAFGAIVLVTSLVNGIRIEDDKYAGMTGPAGPAHSAIGAPSEVRSAPTPQDVARTRLAIQTLNCLRASSVAAPRTIPASDVEIAVRDAKLALLASAWDESEWGDAGTFRLWATGNPTQTQSPARALFEAQRPDCPR